MTAKNPPDSFDSALHEDFGNISVVLQRGVDPMDAAATVSAFYQSTWGDPMNSEYIGAVTAWKHAQLAMEGRVLPNALETVNLTFGINGISRACTHQLVRSRVGAVFGQQGGRDNNWSYFNMRVPSSFPDSFHNQVYELRNQMDNLYQSLVDAGVPYEDARYVLPMGLETALFASYNMLAFKSLVERRLCNRMMGETNYTVRKMVDLVVKKYPWVGKNLRSSCEKRGTCASVSPMFPPMCITQIGGATHAADNPTLRDFIEAREGRYDFPKSMSTLVEYEEMDVYRLNHEGHDEVRSLLDPERVIAYRDLNGLWSSESEGV